MAINASDGSWPNFATHYYAMGVSNKGTFSPLNNQFRASILSNGDTEMRGVGGSNRAHSGHSIESKMPDSPVKVRHITK